jgi:hypothetical protein
MWITEALCTGTLTMRELRQFYQQRAHPQAARKKGLEGRGTARDAHSDSECA